MYIRSLQSFITGQAMQTMTTSASRPNTDTSAHANIFLQMLKQQLASNQNNSVNPQQMKLDTSPSYNYSKPDVSPLIKEKLDTSVSNEPSQKSHTNQSSDLNSYINEAADKYNIDSSLIHSVINTESGYDPNATSHAGAQGLMQLMPSSAESLGVDDPYNPEENIEGGTKYLSQMLDKYNGQTELALTAYNAGPGNVDKHQGVPPFNETEQYVNKVMNQYMT